MELRVIRDTDHVSHMVIPAAPSAVASGALSDDQLEQVAGGKSHTHTSTVQTQTQTAVTTTTEVAEAEVSVVAAVVVAVVPCFIT
jgi:hypothetical protein